MRDAKVVRRDDAGRDDVIMQSNEAAIFELVLGRCALGRASGAVRLGQDG